MKPTYVPKHLEFDVQAGTLDKFTVTLFAGDGTTVVAGAQNIPASDPNVVVSANGDGSHHVKITLGPLNMTPETVSAIPVNVDLKWGVEDVRASEHSSITVESTAFRFVQDVADPSNVIVD